MATFNDKISVRIQVAMEQAMRRLQRFGSAVKRIGGLAAGVAGAYLGWRVIKDVIGASIKEAVDMEATLKSLRAVSVATGRDIGVIFEKMKEQVGGVASKLTIARGFLKGMTTKLSVDHINNLTTAIRNASVAMGEDFQSQFPLIIKAIKQLNPNILDNIGVTVRLDKVNKRITEGFYGAGKQLTEYTQQHAIYTEIMKQTAIFQGQEAEQLETTLGAWQRLKAEVSNAQVKLGNFVIESGEVADALNVIADSMDGLAELVGDSIIAFGNFSEAASIAYDGLASDQDKMLTRQEKIDEFFFNIGGALQMFGTRAGNAIGSIKLHVGGAKASFEKLKNDIQATAVAIWGSMSSVASAIKTLWETKDFSKAGDAFTAGVKSAFTESKLIMDGAQLEFDETMRRINLAFKRLDTQTLINDLEAIYGPMPVKVEEAVTKTKTVLEEAAADISQIFKGLQDGMTSDIIHGFDLILQAHQRTNEQILQERISLAYMMGEVNDAEALAWYDNEMSRLELIQQINQGINAAAQNAVSQNIGAWVNGRKSLHEVFKGIATDFMKYVVQAILQSVALKLVGSIGGTGILGVLSKMFDTYANDRMAYGQGADFMHFFTGGLMDRLRSAMIPEAIVGAMGGGIRATPMLAGAGAQGNITINFHGNVTDQEYVHRVIIPEIEAATQGNYTTIAGEKELLTSEETNVA